MVDVYKNVIVAGSNGGIGSEVFNVMKNNGKNIGGFSRNSKPEEKDNILVGSVDITSSYDCQKYVNEYVNKFGSIDAFINCVGITSIQSVEDISIDEFENINRVNVWGSINFIQKILPHMKAKKNGYIINIGSLRSSVFAPKKTLYSISKSSLKVLSCTLREEVEDFNIKTTMINMGFVDTDIYGDGLKTVYKIINGESCFEQVSQPVDVANAVLFLLELSGGAIVDEINIGKLYGNKVVNYMVENNEKE